MQPKETSQSLAATAVVALAVLAIGFPSLYYPFGRDQGIHAFIAKLAGEGLTVYRDVFNVKPPLTTVIHWLSQVLFGETMRAIRIMDLLLVGATSVMLQRLMQRHLRSAWLGVVAGVAFAVLHYSNDYWYTAQTDGWSNVFVVAAILLYSHSLDLVSARRRIALLGLAGLAVGLSFWLKYTTAVVLLLFPVAHLLYRLPFRRTMADAAAVAAGFIACVAAVLLILYWQRALAPFIDIQDFFRAYAALSRSWGTLLLAPFRAVENAVLVTAVAAIGAGACVFAIWARRRVVESGALLAWLFLGVVAGLAQGKAIIYHLLVMYPSIAAAAAVGAGVLVDALGNYGIRRGEVLPVLVLCCAFVASSPLRGGYRDVLPVAFGDDSALRVYWESERFAKRHFSTADDLALVDYLKQETLSCDQVFIWGYEPGVYFLSQRRPVSRFVYDFPMFTAYYRQAYRDELMRALTADPPAVFVVQHEDRSPLISGHNHDSAEIFATFYELKMFVESRYRPQPSIGRFDIYVRKDIRPDVKRACRLP